MEASAAAEQVCQPQDYADSRRPTQTAGGQRTQRGVGAQHAAPLLSDHHDPSDRHDPVKTYSCCASRTVSRFPASLTTNSKPEIPGAIVTNEIEPSGFFRAATSASASSRPSNSTSRSLRWKTSRITQPGFPLVSTTAPTCCSGSHIMSLWNPTMSPP